MDAYQKFLDNSPVFCQARNGECKNLAHWMISHKCDIDTLKDLEFSCPEHLSDMLHFHGTGHKIFCSNTVTNIIE